MKPPPVSVDLRTNILPCYARQEVTFVEGDGTWLVADDGKRYLDFAGGVAVIALGHCNPEVVAAARAQLDRLWHTSNLYWTEPMLELATRLSDRFGGAQAFFCNSGAEAIEAALKYARKKTGRAGVVALEGSFHGRTLGALSATGQPGKQAGFEPLVPGMSFAEPNNIESLEAAVVPADQTAVIMLEPILGEGGVRPLEPGFAAAASELATEIGALLCFDEIQTGVGRTGSFFAFEQLDVRPDVVTLAKGLANGLPIGCLLVSDEVDGGFAPGDHASTFGGNLVSCAAACAVCDSLTDGFLDDVAAKGTQLIGGLESLSGASEVRGRGLLLAFDAGQRAGEIVGACLERQLLVTSAGETTVRLTPPLTVSPEEIDQALGVLEEVLA